MVTFGKRLKELRLERLMTQKDLGQKLGISLKTVSAYERDERRPDMVLLTEIASIFGVTVDYLLGESNNTSSTFDGLETEFPEGVKVLTRANSELTYDQKKKMTELMNWFIDSNRT